MQWRRRWVKVAVLLTALSIVAAACGGGGEPEQAPEQGGQLTDEPLTLRFIWFEWPPPHALEEFANEHYKKLRPNVTVEVRTVPLAQWHDAIFTQFAARKTDFDIAVLDSQFIGEAVVGGHILDISGFAKQNVELDAYHPYLLAAYGQYPQATTGEYDPNAKLYGLPLLGDTWTMIYRKDLIGEEPPTTWTETVKVARQCQEEHQDEGVYGLAFHQKNDYDVASVTFNTIVWNFGGQIWDPATKRVEGVINNDIGRKAMDFLVNEMAPLTAPGSANAGIDEVNAAVSQGKACIAFNWVAAIGGLLDPANSSLGGSREEILEKLGFAPLPKEQEQVVPLGGMGMHVSAYSDEAHQAEALNFIKWFEQADTQRMWAAAGGVPARTDALQSSEFLNAAPWNKVYADSVPYLRDFWNVPEYAQLLDIQTSNVNAALAGAKDPMEALDEIARRQQEIFDESK